MLYEPADANRTTRSGPSLARSGRQTPGPCWGPVDSQGGHVDEADAIDETPPLVATLPHERSRARRIGRSRLDKTYPLAIEDPRSERFRRIEARLHVYSGQAFAQRKIEVRKAPNSPVRAR